jgi:hypothetical protein
VRRARIISAAVGAALLVGVPVHAQDEPAPPVTLPVVPVPVGCEAPPLPHIVFVGTVVERDYRTVRFEIEQVRGGRAEPFADDGLIDIRYGLGAGRPGAGAAGLPRDRADRGLRG